MKYGRELAYFYQQADAFVFPSRTDTFGLVLVEAMACGTPVAAYPVTGPIDVIRDPAVGALSEDLRAAALAALALDRGAVQRLRAAIFVGESDAAVPRATAPGRHRRGGLKPLRRTRPSAARSGARQPGAKAPRLRRNRGRWPP